MIIIMTSNHNSIELVKYTILSLDLIKVQIMEFNLIFLFSDFLIEFLAIDFLITGQEDLLFLQVHLVWAYFFKYDHIPDKHLYSSRVLNLTFFNHEKVACEPTPKKYPFFY